VGEHDDSVYSYNADGTGFRERTMVVRVQSEAALRSLGVVAVPYAGDSERVEFAYARVRRPDGTVVDTQTSDALDMPEDVTRAAPFYSDLKEKQLPIRSLRVGDTLEWKARIVRTKAEAPGEFWEQLYADEGEVVLSETLELRVPQGMYVNVWSPASKLAESVEDGQHIYRWSSSQLKPTAGKEAEAEAEQKKKHVWTADEELDADQGKLPSVAWTTFKSWEEVGAWYRGLEADRAAASPEIKAKVAELIAGKTSEEDKARAIYAYVSTQIRYIGVAFGVGRYQPHRAAEILANQYGDCKDKHTLLAAMLSAAGINADAVLIGAGIRFNPAVPSPGAFNHLITRATIAGQPVWLDSTAEVAPYRLLYPVIRDRQALVVPATGTAHLDRSPADPPFPSYQAMNAVGTLDKDGTSHSRLTFEFRGDGELVLRSAFRQVAPAQYNQMVQQISQGIGYAGTTSNPEVSKPEDTVEPFKMSYDYEREKAGDWANYKIIPQLSPVSLPRFQDSDSLVRVLNLGTPSVDTSTSAMKLPEGWGVVLPEAVHLKCAYVSYDETYRFEKGTVYAERRVEVLKPKVPVADLKVYKKWADDADLGNDTYIQLTRTAATPAASTSGNAAKDGGAKVSAAKADEGPPVMTSSNAEATSLLRKASALYQQHDVDGAVKALDQAKVLDPTQSYLWSMYGAIALIRGQVFEAIDDFQKELKLHPDSYRVYPGLAELEKNRGERKEAMETLRAWAAAEPSNPTPTEKLMDMLLDDGDGRSALAAGEAAASHLSEDAKKSEAYQLPLGRAQLKAGEVEAGTATLQALVKDSQTEATVNAASFAMADASINLPQAESAVRAALEKMTAKSEAASFEEDAKDVQAQNYQVAGIWGTLGWILFREGKSEEAESYLKASWIAEQDAQTSRHLGEVSAANGRKTQPGDPRKLALGGANGRNGVAEYRLLLREGRLLQFEPTGTATIAGARDLVARAKFADFFPAGSQVTLIRLGYVNCHSGVCELVLEP
jgi:tetratricopeptide (TPR) repeat protein